MFPLSRNGKREILRPPFQTGSAVLTAAPLSQKVDVCVIGKRAAPKSPGPGKISWCFHLETRVQALDDGKRKRVPLLHKEKNE